MAKETLKVSWFPEWLPGQQIIEDKTKRIIENSYQKYWYVNIETPAVERNDVLTSKSWNEVSKQIFGLYWLAQGAEDLKDCSLHFDLTVPLARYIIDNEEQLYFPFKRYQIQKVRRWERQQKWRFKEFYQCDVDVIDKDTNIGYDVEVIKVLYNTLKDIFKYLWIEKDIVVQMNNRKLFDSIFNHFDFNQWKRQDILRLFDDYRKIDSEDFYKILEDLVWDKANELISLFNFKLNDELNIENEEISKAIQEIKFVHDELKDSWVNIIFDPFIARWLDYYSGTIFEMFIKDYEKFGSICGWWRFDNLVKYIREKTWNDWNEYWWVWWSIGLSRLLNRFGDENMITKIEPLSDVIIFNLKDSARKYREEIANILRNNWIRVDIYQKDEKINKQFIYAEKKKIPIWIFAGEKERLTDDVAIKNLNTKETANIQKSNIVAEIKKLI